MYCFARRKIVLFALLQLAASETLASNLTDGHIDGTVVSPAGQAIAGATISAENVDTGLVKQKISDARGTFRLPLLPTGTYTVRAIRQGFDDVALEGVAISIGTGTDLQIVMPPSAAGAKLEEIVVVGSKISRIDLGSSETTLILTEAEIDALPLPRDVTSVAMLAPGTVRGASSLGSGWGTSPGYYASFGGSSVAGNAYYINGMNVTNFNTRIGGGTVPFEFLQEFQIKTGGISAEFGRATGGFINTVTKRGTNEFNFGASVFYEPDSWREHSPDVVAEDGTPSTLGSFRSRTTSEANIYASGPIIRDKLFFYALYNPRLVEQTGATNIYIETEADDAFWGAKLDWDISENHALELTAFSDSYDEVHSNYNFDPTTGTILDDRGDRTFANGGNHWIAKYSGYLTDTLSISALAGYSKVDDGVSSPGAQYPVIFDNRAPEFFTNLGSWVSINQAYAYDERIATRLDVEWQLDRHLLRAGIDHESNTSFERLIYSGNEAWVYWDAEPGDELPTGTVPPGVTQVAQHQVERSGGEFDIRTSSWYVEDSWLVTDDLTLNLGVRNERFENRDANGNTFIKITDQWAPRLGFVWNIRGTERAKLYGSYGRYHLPIASITNVALAGTRFLTQEWFVLQGLNPDDTPQLGPQIGETVVFANGETPDPDSIVDLDIDPMYQDEFTLGFETELGDQYVVGINAVHRDLVSVIEDVTIDSALNDYAQRNGYTDFSAGGFDYYVLTNPATDLSVRIDLDFDGAPETVTLTAEELGYPRGRRKYTGINLFAERIWDGDWFGRIDYTWSKSYGNIEGYVRSDNGQVAAGITSLFDVVGLMDGAYGDLPNDRRHSIKLYGAWEFHPGWSVSANASWTSGKPINAFGIHPTDALAAFYGPESFFDSNGTLTPRGTVGRTSSWKNLDMSLRYERRVFDSAMLTLQLDVFNVFNFDTALEVRERTQLESGSLNSRYGLPSLFQPPRSVRLGAVLEF